MLFRVDTDFLKKISMIKVGFWLFNMVMEVHTIKDVMEQERLRTGVIKLSRYGK